MTTYNAPKPNEIKILRVFDAPLKTVWDAWTDPAQVEKWWGPRGFTLTTHSKELRTGGHWDYTMHGPDGVDYPNLAKYLEVVPMAKLVYDHGGTHEKPALFRVTALFSESKGKTVLDMTMALATPEAATEIKKFIKKAGGDGTWDRLAEHVAKGTSGKEVFVINRSFDTPINTMWEMWTNPDHFSKWLAPAGMHMTFIQKPDMKAGGIGFYSMSAENGGMTLWGKVFYDSFEKPRLLTYRQQFADKDGNLGQHPMVPTWPETMTTRVEFAEEGPNRTRVTVTWEPAGTKAEQMDTFIKMRAGMTQGWTGSFDKLEEHLTQR